MSKRADPPLSETARTLILFWLFLLAGLVFAMIVLGGATRLTHSGLSMVDWRPITGWLPPLSEAHWQDIFSAYQQFPQYQKLNHGMSLGEFKNIFWLEYIHRLCGRVLGVVFIVPFLFFLSRKWLGRGLTLRILLIFVAGGLQGVLGWYMVKSGLVDRPDVSQYRLVAHLAMALLIYGYILWLAFTLIPQPSEPHEITGASGRLAVVVCVLVFLTALAGGFVAGTDAGFAYNTFPLMDGELIPEGVFGLSPIYLNMFEDITTIQFDHRLLATITTASIFALWFMVGSRPGFKRDRRAIHALLASVICQYVLGVLTVIWIVPVPLGVAHQAGAVIVWSAALWAAYVLRRTPSSVHAGTLVHERDRSRVVTADTKG